jgi:oxygen-dependent protoporphyrinogen oxidase
VRTPRLFPTFPLSAVAYTTSTRSADQKIAGERRILILGGGITGLAAAVRLQELAANHDAAGDRASRVTWELWESRDRLGGVLQTESADGFLIERSADSFLNQIPAAYRLAERVGFTDQLIAPNAGNRRASVLHAGQMHPVPDGFMLMAPSAIAPMWRTKLLSWEAKLRMAGELLIEPRAKEVEDESLASFAIRRFGREAYERLIQPLIGGIYTADPWKLSLRATLPRFLDMEREHGSLIRAIAMNRGNGQTKEAPTGQSGARYNQFLAPRHGMSSWVDAIASKLPREQIKLQRSVTRIARVNHQWHVWHHGADQPAIFDSLLTTAPAPKAAELLAKVSPALAMELRAIPYAGSCVVALGYHRDQFARPPQGFGLVVPAIEGRRIIAVSHSSNKFPGRAPDDSVLLRVFVGGALQPELADLPDEQLLRITEAELRDLYGLQGSPRIARIARWERAMPQYHLGHVERIARIEALAAQLPGLALAGAAYRGVGIPQCCAEGERAVEKLGDAAAGPLSPQQPNHLE